MEKDIKTMQTTKGELQYYRDWEREGHIVMINPQTTDLYDQLRYNSHPDINEYGVFWAFIEEQFDKGYKRLVKDGFIKDGDKIYQTRHALYGSKESLDNFFKFYKQVDEQIKENCDPQEVYFYEYNNFECMFSGDEQAYNTIVELWGTDVAKTIKRMM